MSQEPDDKLDRRAFLRTMAFAGSGFYLVDWTIGCTDPKPAEPPPAPPAPPAVPKPVAHTKPAQREAEMKSSAHQTLTNTEFQTLVACVDRVLPKDEDVGGVEAGVPGYIDSALARKELEKMKRDFIGGINAIDRAAQRQFGAPFAQAKPDEQDKLLKQYATMPPTSGEAHFYETLISFSLEGYLGDPSYGGNKDRGGWAVVGFNPGPPMPGMPGMKHGGG
jgi:gluconate 2-dehydrogenase gamma chain